LATGTEILLRNDDRPIQDHNKNWNRLLRIRPVFWVWGSGDHQKAPCIDVSKNGIRASRNSGGNNPAVLTTLPLSRLNNFFLVEVASLGTWVGIGFADAHFQLNGSHVLGAQQEGINSAYFFQGNIKKLQMNGEKEVMEGVQPICVGDYIGIKIDFDSNLVTYYNNDMVQGTLNPAKKLEENTLFPCVDMSAGTEVCFVNHPAIPTMEL